MRAAQRVESVNHSRVNELRRTLCSLGRVTAFCAVLLIVGCVSSGYRPPFLVDSGALVYPAEAKERGIEGEVTVEYDINADGTVSNVRVIAAQPSGVFEEAVLAYVRTWVFEPLSNKRLDPNQRGKVSTIRFALDSIRARPEAGN